MLGHARTTRLSCSLAVAALLFALPAMAQGPRQDSTARRRNPIQEGLPLKPTRTLEFSTTVGSWLSVDVSPDGQTARVRSARRHLHHAHHGRQGNAAHAGHGGGRAAAIQPGRQAHRLHVRPQWRRGRLDHVARPQGHGADHARQGRQVRLARMDAGRQVRAVHARPTHVHGSRRWRHGRAADPRDRAAGGRGAGAARMRDRSGRWARRSARTRATYGSRNGEAQWQYNTPLPDYQLAVYDRETRRDVVRAHSRLGSAFRPTLSPDGKWLVYGTRYDSADRPSHPRPG